MMNRGFSNSPYLKESIGKRRRILKNKMLFYFIFVSVILLGLVFLSRWNKLLIENVVVTGNKATDTSSIEKVAEEDLSGYYLWFLPKSNFLIYPREIIKNEIANSFKALKDVSVNLQGVKTIEVSVSEREEKYLWCGRDVPAQAGLPETCYFMDGNGYIYDEAPYFSNSVFLKFFGDAAKSATPSGNYYFHDIFPSLLSSVESIGKMGINVTSILVKSDGDIELYLSSVSPLPNEPKIILSTDSDFTKALENLQAILNSEPLQTDLKKKYSSLLYIDLRFGNKVYYKFL